MRQYPIDWPEVVDDAVFITGLLAILWMAFGFFKYISESEER